MLVTSTFMPHGMCFSWRPGVLLLHVLSDALIAVAYFSIPIVLVYLAGKRPDFPFRSALWMFSSFIVACGLTHVFAIVVIWLPVYWLEGCMKAITAILSILTAARLVPLLPRILALRSPAELERANSGLAAAAAQTAAANRQLARSAQLLRSESLTDALTGLANRRGLDDRLSQALADGAGRSEHPMSLLMIDVDHFKAYNDTFGHPAGDACLRAAADVIRRCFNRPHDLVTRYGGEEFVVILEDTDAPGAHALAERVRERIAALNLPPGKGAAHPMLTVSVGTTTVDAPNGVTPELLVSFADRALYQAKARGRNCVVAEPYVGAPIIRSQEPSALTIGIVENSTS